MPSIHRPWEPLLLHGIKRVECRSCPSPAASKVARRALLRQRLRGGEHPTAGRPYVQNLYAPHHLKAGSGSSTTGQELAPTSTYPWSRRTAAGLVTRSR